MAPGAVDNIDSTDSCVCINVDPNGDLRLTVGSNPQKSFLVSATALSLASDVFQKMFGANFGEKSSLAQREVNKPRAIALEHDDPDVMEILFRILHHQSELLPRVLDLGTFKNFAVACRNYNCIRAVQPAAKTWFKSSQPQSSSESLTYVAIAYLLDIPRAFRRLTGDLVLNSVESFLDQKLEDNVGGLLPIQVYVHLEHQRAVLRQIIADCLQEPVVSLVSMESRDRSLINNHYVSRASCSFVMHDALLARAYLGELYRLRVFPLEFDQMEIGVVLDKLSDFEEKSLSLDLRIPIHNYNDDCTACTFDSRNHIDELEKTIRSQALGLCLDCVRHGPSRGSECRVKHAWHHVGK